MSEQYPGQDPNSTQNPIPHSGRLPRDMGRELPQPGHDYSMPLDEAERLRILNSTPNSTEDLGDLTPDELDALRRHRARRARETAPHPRRRRGLTALVATVGVAVGGGLVIRAMGGEDGEPTGSHPVATATANPTTAESQPTPAPSATEESPYDPEASVSKSAEAAEKSKLEARKPFYSLVGVMNADSFARLAPSESVRRQYSQFDVGWTPQTDLFPGVNTVDKYLSGEHDPTNLFKAQQEIQKLFTGGDLEKAIAISNDVLGTNYTVDDFVITPNEIPKARTSANKPQVAKFLGDKVVGAVQDWQNLVYALKINESRNTNGGDAGDDLTSYKLDETIHITPNSRAAAHTNTELLSSRPGVGILSNDFKPDSVNSSTALLITSAGAGKPQGDNGFLFEQTDSKDLVAPVLTIIADTNSNLAADESHFGINRVKASVNVLMMPVTYNGKTVATPILLESHTVAFR